MRRTIDKLVAAVVVVAVVVVVVAAVAAVAVVVDKVTVEQLTNLYVNSFAFCDTCVNTAYCIYRALLYQATSNNRSYCPPNISQVSTFHFGSATDSSRV